MVAADQVAIAAGLDPNHYEGTIVEHWGDKEWLEFGIENRRWTLSQFMHGEQGALLCTAKITETVPWYDAKLYASTQVVDEARHVEVFARYLDEKLGGAYPINAHLRLLLDDIVNDSRWDMTYLGMQVMVEGLALAAFGFMHQMTEEPLLKQLLRYVMSDEARHVAFGVLSLKEVYEGMTDAEIKDRQEFAYEAAVRMRDRFLSQEVWQRFGVNPKDIVPLVLRDPNRELFQQLLFSKIVPNCKKLGLLDRNDSWLRRRYEEMGVIQFEDWADTGEEYIAFALEPGSRADPGRVVLATTLARRWLMQSDPRFLVLHALKVKGFAKAEVLAELTALPQAEVEGQLQAAAARGAGAVPRGASALAAVAVWARRARRGPGR